MVAMLADDMSQTADKGTRDTINRLHRRCAAELDAPITEKEMETVRDIWDETERLYPECRSRHCKPTSVGR